MRTRTTLRAVSALSIAMALALPTVPAWSWTTGNADRANGTTISVGVADSDKTTAAVNEGPRLLTRSGAGQSVGDIRIVIPNNYLANDALWLDLKMADDVGGVGLADNNVRKIRFSAAPTVEVDATFAHVDTQVGPTSSTAKGTELATGLVASTATPAPTAKPAVTVALATTSAPAVNNRILVKMPATAANSTAGKWVVTVKNVRVDLLPTPGQPNEFEGRGLVVEAKAVGATATTPGPDAVTTNADAKRALLGVVENTQNATVTSDTVNTQTAAAVTTTLSESKEGQFGNINGDGLFKVTFGSGIETMTDNTVACEVQDSTGTEISGSDCVATANTTAKTLSAKISGVPDVDTRDPNAKKRRTRTLPAIGMIKVVYSGFKLKGTTLANGAHLGTYAVAVDPTTAQGFGALKVPASSQTDLAIPAVDSVNWSMPSTDGQLPAVRLNAAGGPLTVQADAIVKQQLSEFGSTADVVVAADDSPAEILSAGMLARALKAPLMLTQRNAAEWFGGDDDAAATPGIVARATELKASGTMNLHMVGSFKKAVADSAGKTKAAAVFDGTITHYGPANPASGDAVADPVATNIAVLDALTSAPLNKTIDANTGALVSSESAGDVLSALSLFDSSAPGTKIVPIIVTPSTKLADDALTWITSKNISKVLVVGGTSSIATSVVAALPASVTSRIRLAGATRFDTANAINTYVMSDAGFNWAGATDKVCATPWLVSGANPVGGLLGVANSKTKTTYSGCVAVPTTASGAELHPAAKTFLTTNAGRFDDIYAVGSTTAVTDSVFNAARKIVM